MIVLFILYMYIVFGSKPVDIVVTADKHRALRTFVGDLYVCSSLYILHTNDDDCNFRSWQIYKALGPQGIEFNVWA